MSIFKKNRKREDFSSSGNEPADVSEQLRKIAEHLNFLERKIDQILDSRGGRDRHFQGRPGGNGFNRNRNSNGFRRHGGGQPRHFGGGNNQGNGPRPQGGAMRPHGSNMQYRPQPERPQQENPNPGNE